MPLEHACQILGLIFLKPLVARADNPMPRRSGTMREWSRARSIAIISISIYSANAQPQTDTGIRRAIAGVEPKVIECSPV
jgi:hypothetical protein